MKKVVPTIFFALALLALLTFSSFEDVGAYVVAVLGLALGAGAISLVRDPQERAVIMRLFLCAFLLRLVFTVVFYQSGLARPEGLGGGDDATWVLSWAKSQFWKGIGPDVQYRRGIPNSFWNLFDHSSTSNIGYLYLVSCFYYLLGIQSQMASSFLNCFGNALTVVLIYKIAREFYSSKASQFAAAVAIVLPGFLIWSALSLKEPWMILMSATTLFATIRFARTRNPAFLLLIGGIVVVSYTFRFYVAFSLVVATSVSLVCLTSRRPLRSLGLCVGFFVPTFIFLQAAGVVQLDVASIVQSKIEEARSFGASTAGSRFNTGVTLTYDVTTPYGVLMTFLVGASYLLFSPFPWQGMGGRQIYALPDVILWWVLIGFFILPGIRAMWRRQRSLLLSVASFAAPLVIFYSIGFGNIGLAYRQRAQLMPFFLVLAAAGYETRARARLSKTYSAKASPLSDLYDGVLNTAPGASRATVLSTGTKSL